MLFSIFAHSTSSLKSQGGIAPAYFAIWMRYTNSTNYVRSFSTELIQLLLKEQFFKHQTYWTAIAFMTVMLQAWYFHD